MKTLKKALSLLVAMTLLVACFACLGISVSAATKTDIVRDGLVVWYDASNNSNGIQEYEATVWKDLTGNGNHMPVKIDENNYWTDNAFHVTNNPTYFPDAVVDIVNSEEYTFEMVLGEVDFTATNWITLMCSDNDEFSLFIRVPNGTDTDDNLEFKYNDKNQDRPKVDNGAEMLNNSTFTVTFDMTDLDDPLCTVYVNGVAVASGVPQHTNIADTLMWGHSSPQRAWGGDVYGFRFYDRCLSPEEVAENSSADERNYRNGNYFEPTVEYDGSNDEDLAGVDLSKYKNDVVVLDEFTDLVPSIGEYGCLNVHNLHFYGEHEGVKVMPTTNDDGTITGNPLLYVNYSKYVRRIGLENLSSDTVKYVAVKIKISGTIEDMNIWGLAGDKNSHYDANPLTADNWPECTGESEYMLFNMEDMWNGLIDKFAFQFVDPAADTVIYIEEIALFADQAGAYAYAGKEVPTEAPTEAPTETPTETPTEAPTETPTETPTGASTTEAPTEKGCGSVVGFSAATVFAAIAAFVVLKKKD